MKIQVFSKYLYLSFTDLLNLLSISVYKGYIFLGKSSLNFDLYLDPDQIIFNIISIRFNSTDSLYKAKPLKSLYLNKLRVLLKELEQQATNELDKFLHK